MLCESGGYPASDGRALNRFLIVDRHEPVRQSLACLIERRCGWRVVGEAACAADGLRIARERRPDAAIVDVCFSRDEGFEFIANLAALARGVRIVGFSFHDDPLSVGRFLEAGGHAFVSKHEPPDALVEAIELAFAGRIRVAFCKGIASDEQRSEQSSA